MANRLYSQIVPGCYVTIEVKRPHWREAQTLRGRAIFEGPAGWVLNLGGRHGTPGIASPDNVIKVTKARKRDNFTRIAEQVHGAGRFDSDYPPLSQRQQESCYDGG